MEDGLVSVPWVGEMVWGNCEMEGKGEIEPHVCTVRETIEMQTE